MGSCGHTGPTSTLLDSKSAQTRHDFRGIVALPQLEPLGRVGAGDGASLGHVFTGLVRERGIVAETNGAADGVRLVVSAPETAAGTQIGDSVAVDGVCLTAVAVRDGRLAFDAVPETLARTTLGALAVGSPVNLEPALRAGDPLGGHYVQGHVDGVGAVRSVEAEGDGRRVSFAAPAALLRYIVEKGSIAVQGTSLTVAAVDEAGFEVALIPHTLEATTLGALVPEQPVNLETDVLAKYVEKLLPR
jgi:riboflavin synthase